MSYNSKYTGVEVENLLGKAGTALQEHQDISHLATKTELSKKQDTISDIATIRANAEKGATALQSVPSEYVTETELSGKGYATKVDVGGKQDIALKFENKSASVWVGDSTYEDFPYRCDIACSGVTSSMYADVVFDLEQATSGDYAPLCETKTNIVSIWSALNESIIIPTILITK